MYQRNCFNLFLIALILSSVAHAAGYAPLYFESLVNGDTPPKPEQNTKKQQEYWDELMKYKIFGAHGITFNGQLINIPDESGWFGTADGNFDMAQGNVTHVVGGPIMIGGNMVLSNGTDTLSTGPVRVLGNVEMGYSAWPNGSVKGPQCVKGSVANEYVNVVNVEQRFFGENYNKCPSSVPQLNEDLRIPAFFYYGGDVRPKIEINNSVANIDVPSGSGTYDILLNKIVFSNEAELNIRMPAGGRLTRIFLQEGISVSGHPKIRVQYMSADAKYDETTNTWSSGTATGVENKDYSGNLLFYATTDLAFPAITAQDSIQGTFITTGKITIEQHMTLAGQLLADEIYINSEFDGSGFRYVPFDPPLLPRVSAETVFPENNLLVEVPIKLTKETKVDVHFKYCFELAKPADILENGMSASQRADNSDFNHIAPVCGVDEPKKVLIAHDTDVPTEDTRIMINVKLDEFKEVYEAESCPSSKYPASACPIEILTIHISDLEGAVMENNARDGTIDLLIEDVDILPVTKDLTVELLEDDTLRFNKLIEDSLLYYYSLTKVKMAGVIIDSLPTSGVLNYKNKPISVGQKIPLDSLSELYFVGGKDEYGNPDKKYVYTSVKFAVYDANGKASYEDKKEGYKTLTFKVTPVNDAPVVKPADFTISGHVIKGGEDVVLKGKIDVKDVDDTSFTYIFDPDDENFAVVDSLFAIDKNTGAIYVKPGVELNRNIADSLYTINVIVSDKSESTGDTNDILSAVSKVTLKIDYANHAPTIDTDKVRIPENSKPGTETDSTLKASDKDVGDTSKIFELVGKSDNFDVSKDGVISVKPGAKLDYDKSKSETITVKVCDEYGDCTTKKVVVEITDINVEIVKGENDQNKWEKPSGTNSWVIKTNDPSMKLTCTFDDSKKTWNDFCKDTTLVEGCYYYDVVFGDTLFAGVARDSVKICYSSAAPVVKVTTDDNNVGADNIYTIVEGTDSKDTSYYVNSPKKNITVSVIDTVTGDRQNFSVGLDLDTVGVDKKSLAVINAIREKSDFKRDEDRQSEKTPVNGEYIKVTYKDTTLDRIPVNITYMTDKNGEPLKVPVETSKGKIDSIEVITVTYVTKINGRDVSISYKADAITGSVLMVNSQGNLMYESAKENKQAGYYTVSYDYVDSKGKSANVSYVIDNDGSLLANGQGDIGYNVSYTYKNEFGNAATGSVFIVLDRKGPKVEIVSPANGEVIRATFVDVVWKVDGVKQDTLSVQSLKKGLNQIVRFYKDKAGNMAADTIMVLMKDAKDIELEVEQPVTVVTKDKVEEYYAANPPKKGQTFAVSIRNPKTGEEFETKIGGTFKTEEGSLKAPYPDVSDSTHLGPTLAMRIKVPQASNVGGLATLDDLVINGKVNLSGVDAAEGEKVSVEDYVDMYCPDLNLAQDSNLYDIEMKVDIWIYTSLGNFVDKYSFTQNIDDPAYVNDVGLLDLYFELKPDEDGYVRTESGRLYATGAYVYKVDVKMKSTPRCVLPPVRDNADKVGNPIKTDDYMLKSFGYKRPKW